MSTNLVTSLLEQDTECNSVSAVAKVLAGVRPSDISEDLYSQSNHRRGSPIIAADVRPSSMSEDLYCQSNHRSGSPIIAIGAVVYAFSMHCDVVSAAQPLLLHPSHLKPIPKETVNLTASNGVTISSGNITLDSSDLSKLDPDKWLNDQVKKTHMALC